MIQKNANGTYEVNSEWTDTSFEGEAYNTIAQRKLQRQILEKAIQALEEVPKKYRDQSSTVMAVKKSDLLEAKKRIREFRHSLCEFLQRDPSTFEEVYQLSVSLFPLSQCLSKQKEAQS